MATRLRDGAIAGIVGGIVGAVWGLAMSPILGTDVVQESKLAAVPLLGRAALQPDHAPLAFLVGGASHFAVSIAWGVVFALLWRAASPLATIAAGALFGAIVWRVMYDVVLPILGVAWIVDGFSPVRALTEHVVFGVGAASGLILVRRHPRPSEMR